MIEQEGPDPATATAVEMLEWFRTRVEDATCRQWAYSRSEFEVRAVRPQMELFETRIADARAHLALIDDALDADDPESAAGQAIVQLARFGEATR